MIAKTCIFKYIFLLFHFLLQPINLRIIQPRPLYLLRLLFNQLFVLLHLLTDNRYFFLIPIISKNTFQFQQIFLTLQK